MRPVRTLATLAALSFAALPAHASTFVTGEFFTYSQVGWGNTRGLPGDGHKLLEDNFNSVFSPDGDLLQVGIPGPAGFSMIFDSADAITTYLPPGGAPGVGRAACPWAVAGGNPPGENGQ